MDKLIITVAPVGAEVSKKQQPNLPLSPEEIAHEAVESWKAGAALVHLHVRDADGNPTQDRGIYARAIERIKKETDLIIQVSTGGAVGMSDEERLAPLALKPEMASLSVGSCNFGEDVFYNPPASLRNFARQMQGLGIKPELEIFEAGMINNALNLLQQGYFQAPLHFDFVLGVAGAAPATVKQLLYLTEQIPQGSTWSVAAMGRFQLPMAVMAIMTGGHVRVGFEDNIYYHKGVLALSNAQLVARISRIAGELGREIATPTEARKILTLL